MSAQTAPAAGVLTDPGAVVAGALLTAVVGYAIAVWLARVDTWAERVEEQQYCRPPLDSPAPAVAQVR